MHIYQLMPVDRWKAPQPGIDGVSLRFSWRNWHEIPHCIDAGMEWAARNNKLFMIRPMAGKHSIDGFRTVKVAARKYQEATRVPIPWRKDYQSALFQWLVSVADYVRDSGAGQYFSGHMHVPGYRDSSEMHFPKELQGRKNWQRKLLDDMIFRIGCVIQAGCEPIVNYKHIKGVSLDLLEQMAVEGIPVQHNQLKADIGERNKTHRDVMQYSGPKGFQTVGAAKRAGNTAAWMATAHKAHAEWLELYENQIEDARRELG